MREVLVRCGGARARARPGAEVLALDVDAPRDSPEKVTLRLDHITDPMVSDLPHALADLVEIACYVYCADQFTRRESPQMTRLGANWRRTFRFVVPVRQPELWSRPEVTKALANGLAFLSDDAYEFSFVPKLPVSGLQPYLDLVQDGPPAGFVPDRVILFSGGLDSLAGAVESLVKNHERVALVSHESSPMVRGKQLDLVDALRSRGEGSSIFHVSVLVRKGKEQAVEFTQRSRSFLFATLGFVVARLFRQTEVTFFENGVVSMNLPVARHVIGARATRTTHPRVLSDFGRLFSLLAGEEIRVANPFFWFTKTEIVERLGELDAANLIPHSFSCSRVRASTRTRTHCGVCSQCIDRRFAVLSAGLQDHEPTESYEIDLLRGERPRGRDVTLAESYVLTGSRFSSMTPTAFAARYGEVYRALPYLDGSPEQNLKNLHQLHARHGSAIEHVIQAELRRLTVSEMLALPSTSLLALVQSNVGEPPPELDLVESEPSASEQAATMKVRPPARPICFAIDDAGKRVVFTADIVLRNSGYRLFKALLPEFTEGRAEGRPAEEFRFISAIKLAARLEVEEQTLRQSVSRTRRTLSELFRNVQSATLDDDDIIESLGWKGYRLNPFLDQRSLAFVLSAGHPQEEMSRKSQQGVTSQQPGA